MSELRPGTVIAGRFRIERRIGAGAMAFVYEALHLELRQKVALKFLNDSFRADPDAASRFVREGRAQFSLRSEHVGRIFDVGHTESGQSFIVMELLEGQSLKEILDERTRLSVRDAIAIMRQVCEGVGEAHALGIVHRDLKPGTIFVSYGEGCAYVVKVIDFGLAKARDHASEGSLTAADMLIGTPRYMAPEQFAHAGNATSETDVWSLGVVLYRLLTGELPFDGPHPLAIAAQIRSEDPIAPHELVAEVPPELSALVLRCLSREAGRRFPNATALGQALGQLRAGSAREVGARGARGRSPAESSSHDHDEVTSVAEEAPISRGEPPTLARRGPGSEPPTVDQTGAERSMHAVVVPSGAAIDASSLGTSGTSETRIATSAPTPPAPPPPPPAPPRANKGLARARPAPGASPSTSAPPAVGFAAPSFTPPSAPQPMTPHDGVPAIGAQLPAPIEEPDVATRYQPATVGSADHRRMTAPMSSQVPAPPFAQVPREVISAIRASAPPRPPPHAYPGHPQPPLPGEPDPVQALLVTLRTKLAAAGPAGIAALAVGIVGTLVLVAALVAEPASQGPVRTVGGVAGKGAGTAPPHAGPNRALTTQDEAAIRAGSDAGSRR